MFKVRERGEGILGKDVMYENHWLFKQSLIW